ncbi:MAG TPA: S66 peptidase family protein [Trueperaceae bacterium]|nr:S66 peptidase family protein [Trueperaceae bacterium]
MLYPTKPRAGERVAVLSPAAGLPAILPLPFDLGLTRLREEFGLVPVEYPTTRQMGASPRARAADVNAAFADPSITAIIASIGGDDLITVLRHLDPDVIRANPKPFFGFSDCTNLLAYLYRLGIVGYHGGAIMTAFGRPLAMHDVTRDSLEAALFSRGEYVLPVPSEFTDIGGRWEDPATFTLEPEMLVHTGWTWHHANREVTGRSWGGCLEIVAWLLMADVAVPPLDEFEGSVLFFETSEEMPPATEVYQVLRNLGERGILERCGALLLGRPKAWTFQTPSTPAERDAFVTAQEEAVARAMSEYAPGTMYVTGLDIGHTDPQLILPYGGNITVDGALRRITVEY